MRFKCEVGIGQAAGERREDHAIWVLSNPVRRHPGQASKVNGATWIVRAHEGHHCTVQLIQLREGEGHWLIDDLKE